MTAPRLTPLDPPYDPLVATDIERLHPPGLPPLALFRTLARNPRVLSRIFAGGLLDKGSIALRQRELVILRTCALNGAGYEWGVHVAFFAVAAGLDTAQVAATAGMGAAAPVWTPDDRLVLELAEALHAAARLDDAAWQRLADAFDPEQIIELITLCGFYRTISLLVNVLAVAPEPYAPRLPREARGIASGDPN